MPRRTAAVSLAASARRLAIALAERDVRVVLAESCTAGLAAAALARTPGISRWLCGSAVVYREATKESWLGVSAESLRTHTAESEPVAGQMAVGVLGRTPEADWAVSATGHLGPGAPAALDGVVFIGLARRAGKQGRLNKVTRGKLRSKSRLARQREAAALVLDTLRDAIVGGRASRLGK